MKKILAGRPLPVVIFTIFLDVLGIGILIPVIPLLLADPQSAYYLLPAGVSIDTGYLLLGVLIALYPAMQFVAAPILGQLSDVYGRKKLLAISLAGTCLSYLLFAFGIVTKNIPLLFFARALDGITGGNISIAQAAIADISTPQNRTRNFGLIGAAFGLGFILGPFLGGKLSDPTFVSWFNAATPFWFAAILSFLDVLFVMMLFPETLRGVRERVAIAWGKSLKNIGAAFRFPALKVIFFATFLSSSGFAFFTSFFSVFMISKFGYSQGDIGDFYAYQGIWIILTQGLITGLVAKRFKSAQVLKVTMISSGILLALYTVPQYSWQLFLISPLFSMMNGLTHANTTTLVSASADAKVQGEVLGIYGSVNALGQAIPPVFSGLVAIAFSPTASLWVAAGMIMLSGVVFIRFYKPGAFHNPVNPVVVGE